MQFEHHSKKYTHSGKKVQKVGGKGGKGGGRAAQMQPKGTQRAGREEEEEEGKRKGKRHREDCAVRYLEMIPYYTVLCVYSFNR